ncbi:hypothetical protein, partial [Acinetobacter baumannii]
NWGALTPKLSLEFGSIRIASIFQTFMQQSPIDCIAIAFALIAKEETKASLVNIFIEHSPKSIYFLTLTTLTVSSCIFLLWQPKLPILE